MVDVLNSKWSELDASNNAAAPDGIQGGYAPSTIAPTGRAARGAFKRQSVQHNAVQRTGGSNSAYTLTYGQAPEQLYTGQKFAFFLNHTNTGAATLNINGMGTKALARNDGVALTAGQLVSGTAVIVFYDGTAFRLQTEILNNPVFTGTITGSGAGLTNVPATSLTGTVPNARMAGDYSFDNLTLSRTLAAEYVQIQTAGQSPTLKLRNSDSVEVGRLYADGGANHQLVLRKYNPTTGAGEGYIRIDGNGVDDFKYNGSKVWTDADTDKADITGKIGYTPASDANSIVAGNGLSGGGTYGASRTITLGTPGTITNGTGNAVSATSHTHALTLVAADITGTLGYTPANGANSIVAGNGLTGGGTYGASRTVTLGTPTAITATSTNLVSATSHTHDFDFASFIYTGTDANYINFPIGSYIIYGGSYPDVRNGRVTIRLGSSNAYTSGGSGTVLPGTWTFRGRTSSGEQMAQKVG